MKDLIATLAHSKRASSGLAHKERGGQWIPLMKQEPGAVTHLAKGGLEFMTRFVK